MKYKYTYRNTATDIWMVSMNYIYSSMVGICNIVFTMAMIILAVTKWQQAGFVLRALIVLAIIFFPVIQPVVAYQKAVKQTANIVQDTTIGFDDTGLHIQLGKDTSDIPWSKVHGVNKKPAMLIVFSDPAHGFILTNRILGEQKGKLYQYILSKLNK